MVEIPKFPIGTRGHSTGHNAPESDESMDTSATSAEFVRGFAHWRDVSRLEPVHITHHGRATHVLLSIEEFDRLKAGVTATPGAQADQVDTIRAFAEWIDEAILILDEGLNIEFANRVAQAISRRFDERLDGKPILKALPEIQGSMLEVQVRRTAQASEPTSAEVPSPFTPGDWLRMQSFPLRGHTVVVFRDITEQVERHRQSDVKSAIMEAMQVHGKIGHIRISMRGTIDRVDKPICQLVDLDEARLLSIPFIDLVDLPDRVAVREALERVLREAEASALTVRLITNRGRTQAVHLSIAQLRGAYGAEGAIVLLTPAPAESADEQ